MFPPVGKLPKLTFLLFAITFSGACSQSDAQNANQGTDLVRLGKIESKKITESSGLVRASDGGFWTINDSGNEPELYRMTPSGGLSLTLRLKNGTNVDWEAMARFSVNGTDRLLVADVGDNLRRRKTVSLYMVDEPSPRDTLPEKVTVDALKIDFQYEDGPHNCEAVAVDQRGQFIWLIEKVYVDDRRKELPGIYRLPLVQRPSSEVLVAKRVAEFPVRNVTGMDISKDQNEMIIRDYFRGYLFRKSASVSWEETLKSAKPIQVALPLQRQGEAVCFSSDARSVVITSEKKQQPIWQITLPKAKSKPENSPKTGQ